MRALADHAARERLGIVGAAGTVLLHAFAMAAVLFSIRPAHRAALPTYRVELVAAPLAAVEAAQPTPGAAETAKAPPARATRTEARARPQPAPRGGPSGPVPAERRPQPAASKAAPAPRTPQPAAPAASPNTKAAPGTGNAAASVSTGGVEFPFQGYLMNLQAQIYRRFNPPASSANLEAELLFFVHRDGSITGLQFVRRSGSFAFDLEAQGAVESAARAGTFGPLPAGFAPDMLPVSFYFSPRAQR